MKRNFIFLLLAVLVLVFSNSSWAEFPCDPLDSATTCCGASGDWERNDTLFSKDLGICDTLYVVPWPHTDTCFGDTCINNPGENFPCFVYVNVFVTHDSTTFYYEGRDEWWQDSIAAFITPLLFWHQPVSGMDADSVIFPYGNLLNPNHWNNTLIDDNPAKMGRSMFRHFVDTRPDPPETTFNRMLEMVENWNAPWNVFTDFDSVASPGDPGHAFFSTVVMDPNCQRWYEGERVLLATLTFQVYVPEDCDTTEICLDSAFWSPAANLTFTRVDARVYFPRHLMDPICFRVYDDTVEFVPPTDVRWIEDFTEEEESRPTIFSVSQNYPNPFNPVTNFRVALPEASHVKIEIFNILGQKIKTLVDEDMRAGVFIVDWDGKDERGVKVSSGIYFYRITTDDFSDIKKMVLLK